MTQQALVADEVIAATPQQRYVAEHLEPDTRFLSSIQIRGLLSFGPDSPALPLNNLNVIIGANGTGKSNLLDVIQLLAALPGDFGAIIEATGGIESWLWRPSRSPNVNADHPAPTTGQIDVTINRPYCDKPYQGERSTMLDYHLKVGADSSKCLTIQDESLSTHEHTLDCFRRLQPNRFEVYDPGSIRDPLVPSRNPPMHLYQRELPSEQSLFYQMESSADLPNVAYLARLLSTVKVYRNWSFGRSTILHRTQHLNQPSDYLAEDMSNISLIMSRLVLNPPFRDEVLKQLKEYAADVNDFDLVTHSGTAELHFREGGKLVPASRLSDGALRYLCLLLILCDPAPPPLICIDQPELGLHMDVLLPLADLIQKASMRTQIIVTTHSDLLLDCFSDEPEAVILCEKIDGTTTMDRLTQDVFDKWRRIASAGTDDPDTYFDNVGLAQLWQQGMLGATR